ncbi:MAG: enoyl-CoA hydratase-related protein [Candidatus Nezhaarchaeales archaeon]
MSYKHVIYEKAEGIARIVINRPRILNVLNQEVVEEIHRALLDADRDRDIRVIVLTGAGEKAFCAGIEVSAFKEATPIERRMFTEGFREKILNTIMGIGKPVIAAVNGYALGAGCELVLACDLAIASEDARFGQPEINIGAIPGGGGTQQLPRVVGLKKAKELMFTGDMIDAKEAERLGIVNKVVQRGRLEEEVKDLARRLAEKSPIALRMVKEAVNKSVELNLSAGLAYETELFSLCSSTEDFAEGVRAFLEKRKPTFKGG